MIRIGAIVIGCAASAVGAGEVPFSLACFRLERQEAERAYERALNDSVSAERLRAFHELLASEPHMAGTPGDLRVIESIARAFQDAGLEVETHWVWLYLSKPIAAELEIVAPERRVLDVTEPPIDADPFSTHPDLPIGFNAYSGSGEAAAEVVYANYGRKEDFEKLRSLGVDCAGKIVIARYGGNFRGYKAKFAEAAGAAGLIIYTDPADSGYMRGLMYPEGGWATDRQIQRGTLLTLPYYGDPLTPFVEATEDAPRRDPEGAALPRIPVQPVGWASARQILERMTGAGVPEESWQGALPFPYRVTGGPDLRVRLMVKQERAITRTANVVGTLRGTKHPDELVILGCHHDAWGCGAADPTAGTHVLLESARVFGEAARRGDPGGQPERSILFCAWAAEEFGILGSSEWVEANIDRLTAGGVAYFNLDMAAMGPLFNASGAPTLATLVMDATRDVPQARDPDTTVFEEWTLRKGAMEGDSAVMDPAALVGTMGGGSDHVGFYFHACIPSASVGGGGSRGTSYHSNYDTLHWYRQVVGEDYEPSVMVTRVLNICAARLARADVLPIDPRGIGPAARKHLATLEKSAKARGVDLSTSICDTLSRSLDENSDALRAALRQVIAEQGLDEDRARRLSLTLRGLERLWSIEGGLPGRPWLRSAFMAPDRDSGYASWPLPELREMIEEQDQARLDEALSRLGERLESIRAAVDRMIIDTGKHVDPTKRAAPRQ